MSYGIGKQPQQGGKIKGKGTGTSDDIKKTVPSGSYIMPKDSTDALGEENLARLGQPTDVNLSNGEFQLTPDQVHQVGVQALDQMKGATHTPIDQPTVGFGIGQGDNQGKPELFFANGGLVSAYPSADDIRKAQMGRNVPSAGHAQDFLGRQNTAQAGGGLQSKGSTYNGQSRPISNVPATTTQIPPTTATQSAMARTGSKVAGMAKGLGAIHGIGSMISGATTGFNTSTEDYATRMGLDPNGERGELANLGIRGLGVLSDVGNAFSLGHLGERFPDKKVNQAQANLLEQQARFAAHNASKNQTPQVATQAPAKVPDATPSVNHRMNNVMYGGGASTEAPNQVQAQSGQAQQGQAQTRQSNDPYAIQQKGNSFSYSNPNAAAQARANGVPELQSSGFANIKPISDPKGMANYMSNVQEMGPSQQQIDWAVQQIHSGQGFGIQYPSRPQRNEAQEAERRNVLEQVQAPIKGARGMTANQRSQLMEMQTGEDNRATQMYSTDANNATSQSNTNSSNMSNIAQTMMREQGSNTRTLLGEQGQNSRFDAQLGLDAQKFNADYGLKNREMNMSETKEGFGIRNSSRIEKLNEMYDKAETDEDRQAILQRINRLSGNKDQGGKDRYMTVGGGQEYNKDEGVMINRPQQIFDTQTGRLLNMDGSMASATSSANNGEFDTSKFKDGAVYQSPSTGEYFRWGEKTKRQIPVQQ